jgi:hypothetical protein
MEPDDPVGKPGPQEHAVASTDAQQPTGVVEQDNEELTMPTKERLQSQEPKRDPSLTKDDSRGIMADPVISAGALTGVGVSQQANRSALNQQTDHAHFTSQLSTELAGNQLAGGQTAEHSSAHEDSDHLTNVSETAVSGHLKVQVNNEHETDKLQHEEPQLTAPSESSHEKNTTNIAPVHPQEAPQLSADNDDEALSVREEDAGETGTSDVGDEDGEDDEGDEAGSDVKDLEAQLKRKIAEARAKLNQHRELYGDPMEYEVLRQDDSNREARAPPRMQRGPGFEDYGEQRHLQQPYNGFDPRSFVARGVPAYRDAMHHGELNSPYALPQYQLSEHPASPGTESFAQDPMRMPLVPPMMHPYQTGGMAAPQGYTSHRQHMMNRQAAQYHAHSYGQAPPQSVYAPFPISPYEMQARPTLSPSSNQWPPSRQDMPAGRNLQQRAAPKSRVVEESDSTDDDEPLRTRIERHRSTISVNSSDNRAAAAQEPVSHHKQPDHIQEPESDSDFVPSKPAAKMGFKATKVKKTTKETKAKPIIPEKPPRLQPTQSTPTKIKTEDESASDAPIDWKLPKFEATFEPAQNVNEPSVAKISIPGIYREELLLSTDHGEQETDLLLNIFMPAQKALTVPDPAPATAILNFHTIAVMVIEAFVQFEIGDEWGTGRGHWHDDHDHGDVEYQRLRDAKDADPDEIFFAVIDRWRAGVESNKDPSKLIRGVQEFCDVALDIIYYIKDNGLLKQRKRAVRSDKGVKKGARKVGEDDETKSPAKRPAGKVHSPQVTKKAKVEKKEPKKKSRVSGVTVIRRQ